MIIGDAINDNDHDRGNYRCEGGYRQSCDSYEDYYGNYRTRCRQVYDSCASRRWDRDYAIGLKGVKNSIPEGVSSVAWAKKFKMSHESAVKLLKALKDSRSGNAAQLYKMGVAKKDIRSLAKFSMPSHRAVDNLARSLNQEPHNTEAMLRSLVSTAKAHKDLH